MEASISFLSLSLSLSEDWLSLILFDHGCPKTLSLILARLGLNRIISLA